MNRGMAIDCNLGAHAPFESIVFSWLHRDREWSIFRALHSGAFFILIEFWTTQTPFSHSHVDSQNATKIVFSPPKCRVNERSPTLVNLLNTVKSERMAIYCRSIYCDGTKLFRYLMAVLSFCAFDALFTNPVKSFAKSPSSPLSGTLAILFYFDKRKY